MIAVVYAMAELHIDIFHPLTEITCSSSYGGFPPSGGNIDCVLLHGKMFIANTEGCRSMFTGTPKMYVWPWAERIYQDCFIFDIPCTECPLTAYNSKLVLVGGRERSIGHSMTNAILVSEEKLGAISTSNAY